MKTTIYHNPRCSKSRMALEILHQTGVEAEVIDYLLNPPSATVLRQILQRLKVSPRQLMRTHEGEYKSAGLDNPALTEAELIDAMVRHPIIIERPIVVTEKGVAIGRPPENIRKIL